MSNPGGSASQQGRQARHAAVIEVKNVKMTAAFVVPIGRAG
jgi:hypothetical protein